MKKVVFLISHIPNPRILKRIQTLENYFEISLIYWDRLQKEKETFEINSMHNVIDIKLRAPQGKSIKRIIPLIKYILNALRILKNEDPDIIHAANVDMLLIARIYKMMFIKEIKIVYEVADLPKYTFVKKIDSIESLISKILQKIEKQLTKRISMLILTSPYFWDEYFSNFIAEKKYLFIPNAPYKRLFSKYKKRNNKSFTVGFIGSVRYIEQLKMLIDVVEKLDESIKIFIAGSGPGYKEILEYSKNRKNVEIYGPYNYEKEIVNLYEKIDLVYSVYDASLNNVRIALPNRLYESIVSETPIIAAKGTILGDFIEAKNIGVTINYDNKELLKEELLKLYYSKKQISLYQENCNKIKSDYYFEKNSKKLLNAYKQL